ncbi:MAG: hypothetical protein HOJ35_03130 [Bdellovibrionales bacterium]|jgi:hypothetical protein|nr:hypothetical protein [Bdellovibrionales bacterium]
MLLVESITENQKQVSKSISELGDLTVINLSMQADLVRNTLKQNIFSMQANDIFSEISTLDPNTNYLFISDDESVSLNIVKQLTNQGCGNCYSLVGGVNSLLH